MTLQLHRFRPRLLDALKGYDPALFARRSEEEITLAVDVAPYVLPDTSPDPEATAQDKIRRTLFTIAAAIMVVVFGSFVFEDTREVKLFGLGLGLAVRLDAALVRMVLVPATMALLGDRNWWMPHWLDRLLPRFTIESTNPAAPARTTQVEPG